MAIFCRWMYMKLTFAACKNTKRIKVIQECLSSFVEWVLCPGQRNTASVHQEIQAVCGALKLSYIQQHTNYVTQSEILLARVKPFLLMQRREKVEMMVWKSIAVFNTKLIVKLMSVTLWLSGFVVDAVGSKFKATSNEK